jgi:hypothetical protein
MKRKTHPYADLFPLMTEAELEALAIDIAENGLRQPIVLYHDAILDGRNRLLACAKANVEPRFETYEGDDAGALALVISLNVQRRDLTAAQRALVAARTLPLFEAAASKRQQTGKSVDGEAGGRGKKKTSGQICPEFLSAEQAGKPFKVSGTYVKQAKAILSEAPDLAAQVEACTASLATAYEQLQERRRQIAQQKKDAERVAEFREAVSTGEMTLEEALQKTLERERQEHEETAAEADSRRWWLEELVKIVKWFESYANNSGEDFSWYFAPDAPGYFDHGLDAKRFKVVMDRASQIYSVLKEK